MTSPSSAAKCIDELFHLLTMSGQLELRHTIMIRPATTPELQVELDGADLTMLVARNGELLLAIEHIAAKILRLEPEEHDRISFDAASFKADRDRQIQADALAAIEHVQATGQPYSFAPMTSRERRMLHLALKDSGLPTASSGENPRRFVVLYPMGGGVAEASVTVDRTCGIRSAFRRR